MGRAPRAERRRRPLAAAAWAAVAALLLARGPAAAEPGPVRDLYYGDTLFHFYQDDHFTALTHLMAARSRERIPHHEAEGELLLGGLYLHYGQHRRAEEIFTALLAGGASTPVRDRAWFYLGKLRYQRGFHEDALAAFGRIEGELPPALASQWPMLTAQSHLALGQFDEAVALLDGWQGPPGWVAFARYNLGVALVRLGRLEEGARQLGQVGGAGTGDEPELRLLADKANVALGYAYLQKSMDGAAAPVLEQVRLRGPYANKALLGLGWALAAEGRYREALTPWLELKDRDLLDSAVQESLLAIPHAYGQLAEHDEAAARYRAALTAFEAEIARLDTAIGRAREGTLVPAVLNQDDPGIGRWYWELGKVPESDASRYLYHLIADHQFQEGLRNVRDLLGLEQHLAEWEEKLVAFEEMVANRRAAYSQRDPAFQQGLAAADVEDLRARRDALAARLSAVEAERDVAGLGNTAELDRWQRLAAIEADPGFPGAAAETRERQRLLKGVLLWDLDKEYRYRLWQARRSLAALDTALAAAGEGRLTAAGSRAAVPGELSAFAGRIAAARPRIAALRAKLVTSRAAQEGQLQALAETVLRDQRERLAAYRVQAQFALATIHDRAATAARVTPPAEDRP